MAQKFLDIHLEGMDDNGEKLKRILDENIPVTISVCPKTFRENGIYSKQYPYLLKHVDLVGKIVSREGNILGQQGNMHKCKYEHKFVDCWHENFCLYGKNLSENEQRDLMEKGRETLVKLWKSPEMYVPPNHQFDLTTLKVAIDIGYRYFAERGIKINVPYKLGNGRLVVLPETKFSENGNIKYIHYDEIKKNKDYFENIIKHLNSFNNIETFPANAELCVKNMLSINRHKILRDIIKFPSIVFKK
ncbi:MAG: DUF2334 domain-containing protein [Nanoarchaeota archaeon]